jgi:predicted acetyltransferase
MVIKNLFCLILTYAVSCILAAKCLLTFRGVLYGCGGIVGTAQYKRKECNWKIRSFLHKQSFYVSICSQVIKFPLSCKYSEYINYDVEEDGLYKAYPNLEEYWKEEGYKFPYMIKKGEKDVRFVLVSKNKSDMNYFSIAEFFIMKKYTGEGIGKEAARQLFTLHKGDWQVHQRENNILPRNFRERLSIKIQMGSSQNVWKMEEEYKTLELNILWIKNP